MIISKDLFIFGEQIFATIIPEGGSIQQQQQQQQQQPAIINTTTTTTAAYPTSATAAIINSNATTNEAAAAAAATAAATPTATAAGAAEQVVDSLKTATTEAAAGSTTTTTATTIIKISPETKTTTTTTTTGITPPPSQPTVNKKTLTKQETVAVVPLSALTSPSALLSCPKTTITTTTTAKYSASPADAVADCGVAVQIQQKTQKIQKIPKEGAELKIKQKQHPLKCETIEYCKQKQQRKQQKAQQQQQRTHFNELPMNLMAESVAAAAAAADSDIEGTTEQEPLFKRNNNNNTIKIVTTTAAAASASAAASAITASKQMQKPKHNDCRLQLDIDIKTPSATPVSAEPLSPTTSTSTPTLTSTSSAASTASTKSHTSSTSSSNTSQTTIPSSENLNLSTNMRKSTSILVDDGNSVDHATVTFPFINNNERQQKHHDQHQQLQQQQQQHSHQLQMQQQQQQEQLQQQHPTLQLTFQNINVIHNDRKILTDVSGLVSPGEVLAIMGPSGSGKTTLLDCLSGQRRIDSGCIYLNRETLSKKWRRKIGYVLQEEIFFTQLTLRETVMYTALLRLPESITKAEKIRLVDRILETLELNFCQQTKFGDYMNRGLSGGEKKRANIACELLTNPLLMLLDEPTSGLDSHSAISLMKVLKRYAQQEQKTIVITVHQPSSQMFHMFDKLLLLHNGRTAYFGEVNNIYRHFEDIGVAIKPHYNPADFVLEQLKSYPDIRDKLFIAAKESHGNFLNRNCIMASKQQSQQPQTPTEDEQQQQNGHLSNGKVHHNNYNNKSNNSSGNVFSAKQTDNMLINDIINNYYNHNHLLQHKLNEQHHNHHNNHHHHHHHHNHHHNACDEEAAQHLVWCDADSQTNFSSSSCSAASDCQSGYDGGGVGAGGDCAAEWLDYPTRFHTQFSVLSSRNFKEAKPRMLSKLNWFQTIGLAMMAGAIWFQLPRTEEFLHDLQGWMFFSQTYWMLFALFGALNSFPSEREVISKERRSGAYRLSAYYLAKMCGELPLVITLPTVYLMISYPMLGCSSFKLFFLMLIFLLLNTIVAQSVGFFIGACCMDMNVSITLSALYTLATQLFGGYLSSRIPDGLSWIRYTSMIHYAYQNMQILEFREGPAIRCGIPSSYEICKNSTLTTTTTTTTFIPYEEILKAQNSNSPLWLNTLILMMFFLVFRGLGYAVLRYVRCPKT